MPRHVAFLRAVNTIGRRARNTELCAALRRVGASYAEGVLASGNIVFDVDRKVDDAFVESIEAALREETGFEVPTIVRSGGALRAVQRAQPFTEAQVAASAGAPCVSFLKAEPSSGRALAVLDLNTDTDRLVVHSGEIYWLPVSGAFNSQLRLAAIERIVGTMTVRAMNTVDQIVARCLSD